MTFEQLRIFVAVAEREHVTRAAEMLNVTQSAASGAIAALEAQHDVKLFHRVGRRIELTDAGRMFLEEARAILARVAGAELALDEFGGLKRGTLRIVASQTILRRSTEGALSQQGRRRADGRDRRIRRAAELGHLIGGADEIDRPGKPLGVVARPARTGFIRVAPAETFAAPVKPIFHCDWFDKNKRLE